MKNKRREYLIKFQFIILLIISSLVGCGFGKFGKAQMTPFDINLPGGLNGQSKTSVIKMLGEPNSTVSAGGIDYWKYENHNGWFINLYYVSFGKTEAKDMILEFKDNKVETAYLLDKGSAIGILTVPAAVAN